MKKHRYKLILAVVIILTALITLFAVKFFNKTEKVVYVDLQKVYKDFKMKTEAEKDAESLLQSRQILLDSLLSVLESKKADVDKSKDKDLKDKFEKEKESYLQKKQYFDNSSQQIIEHYNGKLWEEIQRLSIDFAKVESYDVILGKGATQSFVYGNEKLDCTGKFIDYINQHYDKNKKLEH